MELAAPFSSKNRRWEMLRSSEGSLFLGAHPCCPEVRFPFNEINRYRVHEISTDMVLEIHLARKQSSVQISGEFYAGRTFVLCISLSFGGLKGNL